MDLAALVALSRLSHSRRRLADAARLTDQLDGRLESALDLLASDAPAGASRLLEEAASVLAEAARAGLHAVGLGDPAYPLALDAIPDPPLVLWVRGTLPATGLAVAIVGSRAASPAAGEISRRLAIGLAGRGILVISGLARGCDGEAHRGALAGGGTTVAVLGSGADVIYPREHRSLAEEVADSGAVISELPPGTPPMPHHFPLRNRIISGLSRGVVVVEAGEKSGSLITASCAIEQGREVMVVPGGVLSGRNRGGHALLRDGAALVENAEDVLFALGMGPHPLPASAAPEAPDEDPVLAALDVEDAQDLDALTVRTGLPSGRLLVRLSELEMAGCVARRPGGRFVRFPGK